MKNVKNDYINLMNANSLKKKKSVALMIQSNGEGRRDSMFTSVNNNGNANRKMSSQFQQQF